MGALIVSALIAIAAANAGVWWLWGREQAARRHAADGRRDWWAAESLAATREARKVAADNGRLAARVDELESLARAEITATLHERMEGQS